MRCDVTVEEVRPPMGSVASEVLVARQPIMDRDGAVVGYELLYRQAGSAMAESGADARTATVLASSATGIGLHHLVGDGLAFVNASRAFLTGEQAVLLPPDRTVLEIPTSMPVDDQVISGCRALVDDGFQLALDNFDPSSAHHPLMPLVSVLKVDVLHLTPEQTALALVRARELDLTAIALRVETAEQLESCRVAGFDCFQGYFLSRPQTVQAADLSPSQGACLHLLSKLSDGETPMADVERILQTDVGLAYRVLRSASIGSSAGMRAEVGSLHNAVMLMGQRRLASLLTLMLLADDAGPAETEQARMALVRAKMCEILSELRVPGSGAEGFTAGLLSSLDLLLRVPLDQAVRDFPLPGPMMEAILDHSGVLGHLLAQVIDYEQGGSRLGSAGWTEPEVLQESYLSALMWAHAAGRAMCEPDEAPAAAAS
ncbi:MAG: EAL domain-containing protein [Actinomycetota bacterium]|nr:EAL domain-containing protein [Actinomycetota bacterium]